MEWLYSWFCITSVICTYPAWLLVLVFGAGLPTANNGPLHGADGILWALQGLTTNGVLGVIVFGPVMFLLYWFWPMMMVMFYGMRIDPLVDYGSTVVIINVAVTGIIGMGVGFWLANTLLPKVDARFGVARGFGTIAQVYSAMGAAYFAVKSLKAGKAIIHKI